MNSHTNTNQPLIGFGRIFHRRLKPVHNVFSYPGYFLVLPLRSMQHQKNACLARNRAGLLSFFDGDHGAGGHDCLAWLDDLLNEEGIHDASGEVWLHTYPRVLGYTFKPVSFWYCHQSDGSLRAIVVEVNNTFGERHIYLLDRPVAGQNLTIAKAFHVSPFCRVEGHYRFRFVNPPASGASKTMVRIDYDDALGPLLQTSVSGKLQELNKKSMRRAFWRYPFMTFGVIFKIHWQAFKLFCKRVAFVPKPKPPAFFLTR